MQKWGHRCLKTCIMPGTTVSTGFAASANVHALLKDEDHVNIWDQHVWKSSLWGHLFLWWGYRFWWWGSHVMKVEPFGGPEFRSRVQSMHSLFTSWELQVNDHYLRSVWSPKSGIYLTFTGCERTLFIHVSIIRQGTPLIINTWSWWKFMRNPRYLTLG